MDRTQSAFLVCCITIIAFSAVYFVNPPSPRYYPRQHTWRMEKVEDEPSMGWYGRTAWGIGAGLLAAIVTGLVVRSKGRRREGEPDAESAPLPGWAVALLTLVTLAAAIAVSVKIVLHNFHKWHIGEAWTM